MKAKNKIIGKCLIIFLTPILITLYLYWPSERIIFNGKEYQQTEFKIEDFFQKKPTFKNLIADTFSVTLFLDWYKVKIVNNSTENNPYCLIGEPPTVFFHFYEGDPRLYSSSLNETTFTTGGYSGEVPGHPSYYIKSGEESFFIAPSWKKYSINGGLMFGGDCNISFLRLEDDDSEVLNLSLDYDISVSPYWVSWFVQLIIIFMFWLFILSSTLSIWKWIKKDTPL